MTKFNTHAKQQTVKNHEGADVFALSPELELYTLAVTSLMADKYYESEDDSTQRLRKLIASVKPEFVAKLAIYAREQMYLRSLPIVLVVELARIHNGDSLVRKTLARVIQRADEITEVLAYYSVANTRHGHKKISKLSKQIKLGLQDAFNKFDEYQFAKYNRATEIKLRDALFIVHPKAINEKQQRLFDKIANDTLEVPYTWETEVSTKGNTAEVWEALIESGKLPYMATLRNLRNMLEARVKLNSMLKVAETLSSPDNVHKSKQLPFRFLSAYKELHNIDNPLTGVILESLEEAVKSSMDNVKGFDYNTTVVLASDVSGSMQQSVSPKSTVEYYDIGLLLSMLLQSKSKSTIAGMFGDTFKVVGLPHNQILSNTLQLRNREGEVGYSTNGHHVLHYLNMQGIKADKVMMFTDNQMWNSAHTAESMKSAWAAYKRFYPTAKLYLFDLSGYGTTPISTQNGDVYLIAGWSDKVFDVLTAYDNRSSALELVNSVVL